MERACFRVLLIDRLVLNQIHHSIARILILLMKFFKRYAESFKYYIKFLKSDVKMGNSATAFRSHNIGIRYCRHPDGATSLLEVERRAMLS